MAPEPEVRLAGPDDGAEVARLIAGFRDYYGEDSPSDEGIAAMVAELLTDEQTEFLLAGAPAVGVAQIRFRRSVWTGAEDAWLEDVFVAERARRGGTGGKLVQGCIDRARARGCKRIQLDANERNRAARALYESLGFSSAQPRRWDGGRDLYWTLWL
ncbi:MAG: GNAT family N-acetyltransferase [Solirubrobacterales bacterium]